MMRSMEKVNPMMLWARVWWRKRYECDMGGARQAAAGEAVLLCRGQGARAQEK